MFQHLWPEFVSARQADIAEWLERFARSGSCQHTDAQTRHDRNRHVHVMRIVPDDRDLGWTNLRGDGKSQEHAGIGFRAIATIVAGHEINPAAQRKPLDQPIDGRFAIATGYTDLKSSGVEFIQKTPQIDDQNRARNSFGKERAGCYPDRSDLQNVAGSRVSDRVPLVVRSVPPT